MNALIFIPLLAMTWCLGFLLAIFAAHYFLVVLENTASGSDRVVFPEEPLIDWFWKVFYLAWIAGAWMGPLIIFGRLMSSEPWVRFVFTAGGFWLLFPIGMLSSLSANSPWIPFWRGLFGRMAQRTKAVFGFYLLSIPVASAFVASFFAIALSNELAIPLTLVLAPIGAAAYLIYARVLGRLGLILTFTKGSKNAPKTRKKKAKNREALLKIGEHSEQPIHMQPSDMPPMNTPYEGPITGYNVQFEGRLPAEKPVSVKKEFEAEVSSLPLVAEAVATNSAFANKALPLPPPSPSEMALWDKSTRIREPKQPWDASLVTFLFEGRTFSAWFLLTSGLALFGIMVYFLRELRPA